MFPSQKGAQHLWFGGMDTLYFININQFLQFKIYNEQSHPQDGNLIKGKKNRDVLISLCLLLTSLLTFFPLSRLAFKFRWCAYGETEQCYLCMANAEQQRPKKTG